MTFNEGLYKRTYGSLAIKMNKQNYNKKKLSVNKFIYSKTKLFHKKHN